MNLNYDDAKIAIVGRIPPPYGGVSVHLYRLLLRLQTEGISYHFFDLDGKRDVAFGVYPGKPNFLWLALFLLKARYRYNILHFHASNPLVLIASFLLLAGSGSRIVISLHGEGIYKQAVSHRSLLFRKLIVFSLMQSDLIVAINPTVAEKLPTLLKFKSRVLCMPAFIPPSSHELALSTVSAMANDFIASHKFVVVMQAWFGSFTSGEDIYGLEYVAPLLCALKNRFPSVGICTVISGCHCDKHRSLIFEQRAQAELNSDWLILEESGPAAGLYSQCSLFLRPTISDGDSVSVRECLSLGIPVVASDAVVRPLGCLTYPNRNIDEMINLVTRVLQNLAAYKKIVRDEDHVYGLIQYYKSV